MELEITDISVLSKNTKLRRKIFFFEENGPWDALFCVWFTFNILFDGKHKFCEFFFFFPLFKGTLLKVVPM